MSTDPSNLSRKGQSFKSFEKHYDPKSVQARRDRAYEWYTRLAYPVYDKFVEMTEKTKGMDITKEDIDLLPWSIKNGRKRADQGAYMKMKMGRLDQDKAFLWYNRLGRPTKETMLQALEETNGMDIKAADINSLPWTEDGKTLRPGENRYQDAFEEDTEEHVDRSLETGSDAAARRSKALKAYKTLAQPSRLVFRKIVQETDGLGIDIEDIDLLPWDPEKEFVTDSNHAEEEEAARKKAEEAERLRKEAEDAARKKAEAEEAERLRKEAEDAAREKAEEEEAARKKAEEEEAERLRKEAEEAARRRAAEEAEHKLWEERKRQAELERKRKEEEALRKKQAAEEASKKKKEARRGNALEWYKRLAKPTREVFNKVIKETDGVNVTKEDIDLLDWDPTNTYVLGLDDEEERRKKTAAEEEAAERLRLAEEERLRREAERKRKEEEDAERRRKEETERKRKQKEEEEREEAERLRLEKEQERARKAEAEARRLREEEEAEARRRREAELQRQKEDEKRRQREKEEEETKERDRRAREAEKPKDTAQHSDEWRWVLVYRWYMR